MDVVSQDDQDKQMSRHEFVDRHPYSPTDRPKKFCWSSYDQRGCPKLNPSSIFSTEAVGSIIQSGWPYVGSGRS